jgi:RND family efflux transporter MFP subunit
MTAARIGILAVAVGSIGCRGSREPPAPPLPKVTVSRALEREIVEWDEYTGRLQATDSLEVRARVSGYLESIHFGDGAIVKEGDLLFVIDPRPYEAELARAQADLQSAKARVVVAGTELTRTKSLLPSHAASQEQAESRSSIAQQAAAALAAAQAAVTAAALNVEFTHVKAPMAGRAGRHLVTEGNLVQGGSSPTLLTTIVALDPIHCYFEADERAYLKYSRLAKNGQRPSSRDVNNTVEIGLADEQGFPHKGWMDFVDNQFDAGTGTMVGRALVPNPDLILSPGLFARVRLLGSGRYRAMLLPDDAIGTDQSQTFVWVVDAQGIAQYRRVTLGPLNDGLRIIREGLSPEDRVVVAGTQRVRQGMPVAAEERPIAPPPPAAQPSG